MLTVSKLAHRYGLSRSTVLYYERIGLLTPALRSEANYRRYGDRDLRRLEQICVYRNAGLKLSDISTLLDRPENDAASVLKRRLLELDKEVETLRGHQQAIIRLLRNKNTLRRTKAMTKDKWVAIMKASGFTEADRNRWHAEFERSAPDDHQQFLEFLHIPQEEISLIRESSRRVGKA